MTTLELILIPLAICASLAFVLRGLFKRKPNAQQQCEGKCSCKPSSLRK